MRTLPIIGMVAALGLVIVPVLQESGVRVVWNASGSVPIGLYVVLHRQPDVGELALVRLPPTIAEVANRRRYLSRTTLLLKPITAIAGDRVCRFGAHVFVRSQLVTRVVIEDDSLPAWHGCRTLGSGELFLFAEHSGSFDSRYFGPLRAEQVVGTAAPLWIIR